MAANGISTLTLKATRQDTKLAKAEAKRQGKVVAANGTVSGSADNTKNYWRAKNTLTLASLPARYHASSNTGALRTGSNDVIASRPWSQNQRSVVSVIAILTAIKYVPNVLMTFVENVTVLNVI